MGNFDTLSELKAGMTFSLPGGLFIVAGEQEIDRLRAKQLGDNFGRTALVPLSAAAPLPPELLATARILVLEVDPASEASLRRIAAIRKERPDLPIIAALARADVSVVRTLIRQGVADVATLPFNTDELASQILDATATLASQAAERDLAPLITVVRSIGGCGATSVITHLAAGLTQSVAAPRGVCIVDFDLQGGDVASFLGLQPKVTVSALIEASDRLDDDLLKSAITPTSHGFSVIAAPDAIMPLDSLDVDQALKILRLLRQQFDYVLLDLPADWTNWGLSSALASSELLVVTDLSIASLRQAKRRLQLLDSIGVEKAHVRVLINRVERRLFRTIGVDEVKEALGCQIAASLAAEGPMLRSAQDQGLLVTDVAGKSRFFGDIKALALSLAGQEG